MNDHHPLSDDFVFYAANVAQAAAAIAETERASADQQQTPPESIPTPGPDVLHIYIVDERAPEPQASGPVVESTIAPTSDPLTSPTTGDLETKADGVTVPPMSTIPRPSRKRLVLWLGIGMSATLVLLAALLLLSPLVFAPPVTVTVIPAASSLSTTMQVSLSTGTHPAPGSLSGRTLPMLSLTESLTVPTMGVGHQQAKPGHGMVTFYNAAPSVQVIPAGTLLTGKDGTQVVTDQDAVIPVAAYPSFGQATVPAHTAITGPAGNIAANDLYGPCCRLNISAVNHAFSGGQNARTYLMVTAQDVAKVEGILHPQLIQSMKAAFLTDLASGESLVTPFACREDVEGSAGIGEEATSLTLMLTDTCTAVAYHTQELATLVTQQLMMRAQRQLGDGYALLGGITPTILNAIPSPGKANTQMLTVKGSGTWTYQFSEAQIEQMARAVAGKSAAQATTTLLHLPGVSQVELGTSGTLPADPARIHVLVVEEGI